MVERYLSRRFLSSALSLLLFAPITPGHQDTASPKRIEVKAGGEPVIVSGEVGKDQEVTYIFNAKAGQKFTGRVTKKDGNTGFSVTGPDGDAIPGEEYDFNISLKSTLDKTGDYKIIVTTFEKRTSRFTLTITLR